MPIVSRFPPGAPGAQGPPGPGVPNGGTTGQVLAKASNANQDTHWVTGGGSQPASVVVSSAELLTLRSQDAILIPGQPGFITIVQWWYVLLRAGATPYTSSGGQLTIATRGLGPDTATVTQITPTGFVDQATNQSDWGSFGSSYGPAPSDEFDGQDVVLYLDSGVDLAAGDGELLVILGFDLVPTT